MADQNIQAAIDSLQTRYIRALDRKDFKGWLSCFGPTGSYICTSRENHEADMPVAIMMDDCPERLRDRVRFIEEVWSGTFEDYAMRHFVQRMDVREAAAGVFEVESNLLVTHTGSTGQAKILATGSYLDVIEVIEGEALFRSKIAILDDHATVRYLVYPV